MLTVKEIYNNKALIGGMDSIDKLIEILPGMDDGILSVENNYDRTLLVSCSDNNSMDDFNSIFGRTLEKWLGKDRITCPIKYTYNLLPINNTQFILRI